MGKDRLGWHYMIQLSECVREITKQRPRVIADAGEQALDMEKALDTAIFGLFNLSP